MARSHNTWAWQGSSLAPIDAISGSSRRIKLTGAFSFQMTKDGIAFNTAWRPWHASLSSIGSVRAGSSWSDLTQMRLSIPLSFA
jgi:hypothetical protein